MADLHPAIARHLAAFAAKDADAEPFSADGEYVIPGAQLHGREQILDFIRSYWEAFPDARLEIVRSIDAEPLIAAEGRFVGTHDGTLRTPDGEVPATGRSVEVPWMAMYEVRGGEIFSEHLYFDPAAFMTQLGLATAAESTAGRAS
jgi:steroid delta-isomerase-like uncharacterized protein